MSVFAGEYCRCCVITTYHVTSPSASLVSEDAGALYVCWVGLESCVQRLTGFMCVCCDVSALIINYYTSGKSLAAEALLPQLFTLWFMVSLMAVAGHGPGKSKWDCSQGKQLHWNNNNKKMGIFSTYMNLKCTFLTWIFVEFQDQKWKKTLWKYSDLNVLNGPWSQSGFHDSPAFIFKTLASLPFLNSSVYPS